MDTINPIGNIKRLEQPDIKRQPIRNIKIMATKRIMTNFLNGKGIQIKNIIMIISNLINVILILRKLKQLSKK